MWGWNKRLLSMSELKLALESGTVWAQDGAGWSRKTRNWAMPACPQEVKDLVPG